MLGMYILDADGNPKLCKDILEWGNWFERADRIVAQDKVGDVLVSTVFLGVDYNFFGLAREQGKPILWETMIFGRDDDHYQERYSSREAALIGHQKALKTIPKRKMKLED